MPAAFLQISMLAIDYGSPVEVKILKSQLRVTKKGYPLTIASC